MASIKILPGECANHAVLALNGDLDVTGSAQIEAAVGDVVAAGRWVIIDAVGLDFIDCAALGALRRCRARARAVGADVLLAGPSDVVARLLTLTGAADPVRVYTTVAAAVAATRDGAGQYGDGGPAAVPARRGRASSGTDPA